MGFFVHYTVHYGSISDLFLSELRRNRAIILSAEDREALPSRGLDPRHLSLLRRIGVLYLEGRNLGKALKPYA